MKKTLLRGGAILCLPFLAYAQDASYFSWGSVANGNHTNSLDNPAHMASQQKGDKASFHFNLYGQVIDKGDIIDQAENLENEIDNFEALLNRNAATYQDGLDLIGLLQDFGSDDLQAFAGGDFLLTLPHLISLPHGNKMSLGLFGKTTAHVAAKAYYDPQDANRIAESIANQYIGQLGLESDIEQQLRDDIMSLDLNPKRGFDAIKLDLETVAKKYDPQDFANITDIPDSLDYDTITVNLNSEGRADGYAISEFGFATGYHLDKIGALPKLDLGVALKYQNIQLLQVREKVSDLEDYEFDKDNYLTDASHFNIDLGAKTQFGANQQYLVGVTAKNLIPKDVEATHGDIFKLRPQLVLGLGYEWRWVSTSLDVELLKNPDFGILEDSQYTNLSFEFKPSKIKFATFRTGYRFDLQNNYDGVFNAGASFTPKNERFVFDIDSFYSGGNSLGGKLGFGVNF